MPVPEAIVEAVVKDVPQKMSDPHDVEGLVGAFLQEQPHIARYLVARGAKLGGAESVLNTVFHAALIATCFRRHAGASLPS